MPSFKRVSVPGPNFYETILKPGFGDLVENMDVRRGIFGEFTVMDNVPYERKIIDIRPLRNILTRRDASCAGVFSPVQRAGLRKVSVTELDGAVKFCREEFYQGCLKDWREGDPVFIDLILKFFRKAIQTDLTSLIYFGDITLPDSADNESFNVNKFDGIFTQYNKYIADGTIPAAQTFNIANTPMPAALSVFYLEQMRSAQDSFMEIWPDGEKIYYIDKDWADAYSDYLITTAQGTNSATSVIINGQPTPAYKGIPILVNPFFKPILTQTVGANAHYGVLTLRGNFVFATDSRYGTGPSGNEALVVWYDYDEDTWKWRTALKAGTQIALPEHSVLALPE